MKFLQFLLLPGRFPALLVGFVLTMANYSFFSSLLAFFISSSRLTRWGGAQKKKIDPDYREGGGGEAAILAL